MKQQEDEQVIEPQVIDKDEIIFNMSKEIRSLKSRMIFLVILTILGLLYGFYTVFVTILNLF